MQILEAVSDRAVEAAIFASDQGERSQRDIIAAVERDLEGAATRRCWPVAGMSLLIRPSGMLHANWRLDGMMP